MEHGSQQLADWMARKGLNQRQASEELEIHHTTLNKILHGIRLPGRKNSIDIRDRTGIAVDAWEPTRVGRRSKRRSSKAQKPQYWQGGNAHVG